jgi:hypothetical protein
MRLLVGLGGWVELDDMELLYGVMVMWDVGWYGHDMGVCW